MAGREVRIAKIRAVIRFLQSSGKTDHANAVWDLLDNYIAVNPKLLAMQHVAEYTGGPNGEIFGGQGGDPLGNFGDIIDGTAPTAQPQEFRWGAHAKDKPASAMPKCAVDSFHAAAMECPEVATGYLVRVNVDANIAYPMCTKHGEMFDREGYAEWVQTFFGDEDAPETPASLAERLAL